MEATLSSFPSTFFFGIGLARGVPRRRLGGGVLRGRKREQCGGRMMMGGVMDGLRGTQQGLTVLVVRVMALTMYTPENSHTYQSHSRSESLILLFADRPCRGLPRCRRADRIRTGDYSMPSLDFYVVCPVLIEQEIDLRSDLEEKKLIRRGRQLGPPPTPLPNLSPPPIPPIVPTEGTASLELADATGCCHRTDGGGWVPAKGQGWVQGLVAGRGLDKVNVELAHLGRRRET